MLTSLITLAMRQRGAVLLGMLLLIAFGLWSALNLPIDAVPDITNRQVQITTVAPASAYRSAIACPIPRDAPVIIATFPLKSNKLVITAFPLGFPKTHFPLF